MVWFAGPYFSFSFPLISVFMSIFGMLSVGYYAGSIFFSVNLAGLTFCHQFLFLFSAAIVRLPVFFRNEWVCVCASVEISCNCLIETIKKTWIFCIQGRTKVSTITRYGAIVCLRHAPTTVLWFIFNYPLHWSVHMNGSVLLLLLLWLPPLKQVKCFVFVWQCHRCMINETNFSTSALPTRVLYAMSGFASIRATLFFLCHLFSLASLALAACVLLFIFIFLRVIQLQPLPLAMIHIPNYYQSV